MQRRPSWSLEKVAACDGLSPAAVSAAIETGLQYVAAGVRRRSGEPSRSATGSCVSCGDRLGTMMLLRAASIERFRLPRVPPSARRAASVLLAFAFLTTAVLAVWRMLPNPWREHATHQSVPRWFYAFLYRPEGPGSGSEIARGLSLLVEGKYEEAIETLEPWAQADDSDAEAATYLGIARYLSGDGTRGTVRLLESGTSSSRAGRLARWYLANVLLTRGDVEGATAHLTELATVRDWFGRAAEALLETLEEA